MARKKNPVTGEDVEVQEKEDTMEVTVVAKQPQGRWRAGEYFTTEPHPVFLTESQIKAVNNDPLLSIIAGPAAPPGT